MEVRGETDEEDEDERDGINGNGHVLGRGAFVAKRSGQSGDEVGDGAGAGAEALLKHEKPGSALVSMRRGENAAEE